MSSTKIPQALDQPDRARRRWLVRRQARGALLGLALSALVYAVVLTQAIPMPAGAATFLLVMATILGLTRAARGLWALRVARHLMVGWQSRRGTLHGPVSQAPPHNHQSADVRAILALTHHAEEDPASVHSLARVRGLALVDQMAELKDLLADPSLAEVLRRPVAESLARCEADVGVLTEALVALADADKAEQPDLVAQLAARLEVVRPVPAGLYQPS